MSGPKTGRSGLAVAGLLFFAILTFSHVAVEAQITETSLKGTVSDSDGNVIVASTVVAQSEATAQISTTTTNSQGEFVFPSLPSGTYSVFVRVPGFKTYELKNLKLNVGQTSSLNIKLEIGEIQTVVQVGGDEAVTQVSSEGRVSDTFSRQAVTELPIPQRDVFALVKLNAGATAIAGAANSTKLTNSPVVTVNGNRYRGNNYVLDGALNVNANNTGEPAIVPSVEVVEEVQVQTANFSAEFGRGNGSVVNMRTKSGTNEFHGQAWEYTRNAGLNARNFFSAKRAPQTFNQYGGSFGGPIRKKKTFFFASYEGTRNALAKALSFQVETPELRAFVASTRPNSIANRLFRNFAAPTPDRSGNGYVNQTNISLNGTSLPATGTASVNLRDYITSEQYLIRGDHSFNKDKDRLSFRWIQEFQKDQGGTSSSAATNGKAIRGERGFFNGKFGNFNFGYTKLLNNAANDVRFSAGFIDTKRGNDDALIPEVTITGITAPFGDSFNSGTRLNTYEVRDTFSLVRGSHTIRFGGEARMIFKELAIGPPNAGTFTFTSVLNLINDSPFRQTITVNPTTGRPTGFPRNFRIFEMGSFVQDDWKVNARLNFNLGVRWDYFGDATERDGLLSSVILGTGNTFQQRIATAAVGRVERLYTPEKTNFSPRLGTAFDPFGDGKTSVRLGFSLAFQPHHGQSIAGARALSPDAVQVVSQPSQGIGTQILYGIPVPFNPEFARGLNAFGGINPLPGETRRIRPTGFVVNPTIKTQYSESFFANIQRQFGNGWIFEAGYTGTLGVNLERIDDINRFSGDLLDGIEDRLNPNFGVLLFVTNGVSSNYHGGTFEVRKSFGKGFSIQSNYRFSKWIDTSSDTSTGQFSDNSEPGKGAQNIDCLRCERALSMFDIPHRFSFAGIWAPAFWKARSGVTGQLLKNWQISTIFTAQSGRPFSVWNGAASIIDRVNGQIVGFRGGDYNLDGGGGAVGGGFYDRPNAPANINISFSRQNFLTGLFPASAFPAPAAGTNGNLGRNTFRGPDFVTLDLSVSRKFAFSETKNLLLKLDAFNALNHVNLYLPNADLSLATFGKSTQAFEPRTLQASIKFIF
ncbi:MAG: TonB-dependent receptor [Acidobacteria bacterium]|nr:TonB-dependent receptor [Acidobacteriota bacterium]